VQVLFDHPAPTVALVNGHAIAGGCILALCCDVRVATPNPAARIGLNEVALGVEFPPRVMTLVRYRLSPAAAERAVLGSQLLDPVGAREAGLLDEVTSDAAAVARARPTLPPRPRFTATRSPSRRRSYSALRRRAWRAGCRRRRGLRRSARSGVE